MTTMMEIESTMAGMVIGRGGAKIKSIQKETGAVIKIIDGVSYDKRIVRITGSEDSQRKALNMISSITNCNVGSVQINAPSSSSQKKPRQVRREQSPPEQLRLTAEQWAEIESEAEEIMQKEMESYPVIKKDFYVEHPDITALSDIEVSDFRHHKNCILVEYVEDASNSQTIPKPVKTFQHAFHAFPEILKVINKQSFVEPSPVQCQAWPIIMSGHDLIAIAQTGSGKTLAYILPALIHLVRQPVERHLRIGPSVVILGPTRELVQQIEVETKKYVYDNIHVMSIYGGVDVNDQINTLDDVKPDIIIATPGRLNDLVSIMAIKLNHVSYLVLDEADRMLDMGFQNQIELALRHIRSDRQTILTSATWPETVKKLANYYTTNPLHITIGSFDLTTVSTVKQKLVMLKENKKEIWLDKYMEKQFPKDYKVIIFMRKKISVDKLYTKFQQKNINCR
jgi:ATP-dependent RNA helicase DDX43